MVIFNFGGFVVRSPDAVANIKVISIHSRFIFLILRRLTFADYPTARAFPNVVAIIHVSLIRSRFII